MLIIIIKNTIQIYTKGEVFKCMRITKDMSIKYEVYVMGQNPGFRKERNISLVLIIGKRTNCTFIIFKWTYTSKLGCNKVQTQVIKHWKSDISVEVGNTMSECNNGWSIWKAVRRVFWDSSFETWSSWLRVLWLQSQLIVVLFFAELTPYCHCLNGRYWVCWLRGRALAGQWDCGSQRWGQAPVRRTAWNGTSPFLGTENKSSAAGPACSLWTAPGTSEKVGVYDGWTWSMGVKL